MFACEMTDPLDLVREGLARLAAEDRSTWSAAARSDRLLELQGVVERIEAETIRCVAAWDAVGAWAEDSALSARSWLTGRASMSGPDAAKLVRSARLVREHDATAVALETGAITVAHVEALANAAHRRAELYAEHEATLLRAATTLHPQDFHTVTRRWRELADDDLARADAAAAFERRAFHVSATIGGGVLGGFLDPEATAIVVRTLDALQPPDPTDAPEPPRSLSQRRADALVLLCQGPATTSSSDRRTRAGIDVLIDYETFARRPAVNLDALRCDVEGFGPIARMTAERLSCDCAIGRVIMKGDSQILDYGRRTRIVPRRLRRLIAARDEHCQFPGCRAPAAWCDVHHLVHWRNGGDTSERNCALLCRRHHVACHEGRWTLARGPDGKISARCVDSLVLAA